jgi:hypothetical protein
MRHLLDRVKAPRVILVVLAFAGVLLLAAWLYGAHRWGSKTRELRARLDAARAPVGPRTVDFGELEGLPVPVRRYFHAALGEGEPRWWPACA